MRYHADVMRRMWTPPGNMNMPLFGKKPARSKKALPNVPVMLMLLGAAGSMLIAAVALTLVTGTARHAGGPGPVADWPAGFPIPSGMFTTSSQVTGRYGDLTSYRIVLHTSEDTESAYRSFADALQNAGWQVFNRSVNGGDAQFSFVRGPVGSGDKDRGELHIVRNGSEATIGITMALVSK